MRFVAGLFVLVSLLSGSRMQPRAQAGQTNPGSAPSAQLARKVLVLTSSAAADRSSLTFDHAHELLQMPLNWLGMRVVLRAWDDGEPTKADLVGVHAVVTFLTDTDRAPVWSLDFFEREVLDQELRLVHFGSMVPFESLGVRKLKSYCERLGLEYLTGSSMSPFGIRVAHRDPALSQYESSFLEFPSHLGPANKVGTNTPWVTTWLADTPDERRTPILVGPWGGLALNPWAIRMGGDAEDRRWLLDPFAFFRETLGLAGRPVPDPMVVNGRRVFLLHVDGDGFESLSTVEGSGRLCGEVFLDEIIDRYALPMTISIIVASLTEDIAVAEPTFGMEIAREIFTRPWVEVASHAVLHPLNWRRQLTPKTPPRLVNWYDGLQNYNHSMVAEVTESVRFINERLCPPGKKCEVMLWSGVANPREDVLAAARASGCVSLNGGVYRFDDWTNSVGFVQPWGKQVGDEFQVYCGAANENVFDGFFTTMPSAFRHIEQTLERTGSPRILKPANLYVHFYVAERPERLRSVQRLIKRWAFEEPTAPVLATEFVAGVRSAQRQCEIWSSGDGSYGFRNFGGCRTVRFDGEHRAVDGALSQGVLGAKRMLGSLFVHLADNDAKLVFASASSDSSLARLSTNQPGTRGRQAPSPLAEARRLIAGSLSGLNDDGAGAAGAPSSAEIESRPAFLGLHIREANHILRDVTRSETQIIFRSRASSRRLVVFAGMRPGAVCDLEVDGVSQQRSANQLGQLELNADPGDAQVVLTLR